jgi:hypothetical protein
VRQPSLGRQLVPGGEVVLAAIDNHAIEIEEDGDVTPHET